MNVSANAPKPDIPCCFCGAVCRRWGRADHSVGNNPEPLMSWPNRCCDECNETKVIPARIIRMRGEQN